ncbi:MAG: YhbY family RNA-binding protein [Sphaerochaetaceae bacterium]
MNSKERNYLRKEAHYLKPALTIGKLGLHEGIFDSLEEALTKDELVKIRFQDFKEDKKEFVTQLSNSTGGELVALIGHTAILYRESNNPEERYYKISTKKN